MRSRYVRRDPGISLTLQRQLGLIPPQSGLERAVQTALAATGVTYVPERWVGPYRLDFYVPVQTGVSVPLAIEVDGHSRHRTPEGREHDRRKDMYLRGQGLRVVRLPGAVVRQNPAGCVRAALLGERLPGV